MNLFAEYQNKVFKYLKSVEKKEKIILPDTAEDITFELPPKDLKGDMSSNNAFLMSIAKKTSPLGI